MSDTLKTGDKAPLFEAEADGGRTVRLADLISAGGAVLCFYPRDNTPGCTKEACSLRDNAAAIGKKGFAVAGVSTDGVKSHDGFKAKHGLTQILVSDKGGEIINSYGVAGSSNTARRVSFLIDGEGKIRHIWKKVNTASHGEEILEKIAELSL